jgi:hypothetical protein
MLANRFGLDETIAGPHPAAPANVVAAPFPAGRRALQDKLLRDWKLVKRARFNAAKRLERKQDASIATLAIVAFYTGSITLFTLAFKDGLPEHTRSVLEFVSQFFGFFTLIVGLIEQLKDYPGRARELHECARRINALQKQLAATPIARDSELVPFIQAYDRFIADCRPNHDDVDYALAAAAGRRGEDDGPFSPSGRRHLWARFRFSLNTYWLYVAIWVAPILVAAALLAWLPVAAGKG